jgi:O-antigen/teichoic acid export membrane protein
MKRLMLSGLDQAVVAGFNLSLHLVLIRTATAADYGAFMLWQNTAMILASFQTALVSVHLTVLVPHSGNLMQRAAAERMLGSVNLLLVLAVLAVALAVSGVVLTADGRPRALPVAIAFYLAGILAHQHARALALSRADLEAALKVDLILAACGWAGIGLFWSLWRTIALTGLITLMAASAILTAAVGLSLQKGGWNFSFHPSVLRDYRAVRGDSKWAVLGVLSWELQGRSYIFIINWLYGSAALGELFAAQLLSRPLAMLYLSWSMMARPELASLRETNGSHRFTAIVKRGTLLLTAANLLYFAAAYLLWDKIYAHLYAGAYADVGPVVAIWAAITLLTAPYIACSVGLEALRAFRLLFLQAACGCIISLGLVTALALAVGCRASLAGLLLAQALGLVLMFVFLRRALHEHHSRQAAGIAEQL